jgi:hypothetical protein
VYIRALGGDRKFAVKGFDQILNPLPPLTKVWLARGSAGGFSAIFALALRTSPKSEFWMKYNGQPFFKEGGLADGTQIDLLVTSAATESKPNSRS